MVHFRKITTIRLSVFSFSLLFSLLIYLITSAVISEQRLLIIRLTQIYALTAVAYLYITLLASPLIRIIPRLPCAGIYVQARRALGLSAFYFGLLHTSFAFFGQLGGFTGLSFLNGRYLLAISLSATALFILTLMALTSFDRVIQKMGFKNWKRLHRLVYLAAVLILIHALMLGTHFTNLSSAIPQIFSLAISILAFLEALRFDAYLKKSFNISLRVGITTLLVTGSILAFQMLQFLPAALPSLSIHQQHLLLAKQLQQQTALNPAQQSIPGLQGDPTKRYTVDIEAPVMIAPNEAVTLQFRIFDSQNGNPVTFFQKNYEKLMHLVIIGDNFLDFSHIHPTQDKNTFTITTQFPKDSIYHLYLTYQPLGSIEQQAAFTIPVGSEKSDPRAPADTGLTKTVGDYTVSLSYPKPLLASQMTLGEQSLTFTIRNQRTGKAINSLQQYLGAFGHLVMINEKTYDYLHVHPVAKRAPLPRQTGGPEVDFVPLGLTRPIKPGTYRLFAQFNPNGEIINAEFIIQIE